MALESLCVGVGTSTRSWPGCSAGHITDVQRKLTLSSQCQFPSSATGENARLRLGHFPLSATGENVRLRLASVSGLRTRRQRGDDLSVPSSSCGRLVARSSRRDQVEEAATPSVSKTPSHGLMHAPVGTPSAETDLIETTVRGKEVALLDGQKEALTTIALWVGAAVLFGVGIGVQEGPEKASEFFAGYLLEQSLSVDNLFVFVLIFNYFQTPPDAQKRALQWGLGGAVIFRAVMILLGLIAIQKFEPVFILFALVLLFSSYKLLRDSEEEEEDLSQNAIVQFCQRLIPVASQYDGTKFFTTEGGLPKATPLLLTVLVVELSDVAFALDSIPAVFGVTRDPFIVLTSNLFAIVALRALYTLVATSMGSLRYLQPAIAIVLAFVGGKMLADVAGVHVPVEASLAIVAGVLGTGVGASILYPGEEEDP